MDMYSPGFDIAMRVESRRALLLVYRIVSEPTYRLPSKSKYALAVAIKVLLFVAPIVLVWLGLFMVALSGTRPSAEAGGICIGLIFCHYITCTVWLHLINRYITLPYELFTNKAARWNFRVVYENEIPEYQAERVDKPIWVTLSNTTSALTQIYYAPPFPTKKEKAFKIIAASIGVLFFVLAYSSSSGADDGRRMMSIACLMASVCFFALTILRTFKPEY